MGEREPNQPEYSPGENYADRLKESMDWRENRRAVVARFIAGSLAATSIVTGAANVSEDIESPIAFETPDEPDRQREITAGGEEKLIETEPPVETSEGPALSLLFPQEFAQDFEAQPLSLEQTERLDEVANSFREILERDSTTKLSVTIRGISSDESELEATGGDVNLGDSSERNEQLARERAELVSAYISAHLGENDNLEITVEGEEDVLLEEEMREVDAVAANNGLSRQEFIKRYNQEQDTLDLSEQERSLMNKLFDANRSTDITSRVTTQTVPEIGTCDEWVEKVTTPTDTLVEVMPGQDGQRIEIAPIPFFIPPLPKRRTKKGPDNKNENPENGLHENEEHDVDADGSGETEEPTSAHTTPERRNAAESREARAMRSAGRGRRETIYSSDNHGTFRHISSKVAPWLAAAAIAPFPSFQNEAAIEPERTEYETCTSYDVEAGSRSTTYLNLSGIALYRLYENNWDLKDDSWYRQLKMSSSTQSNVITKTRYSHEQYEIDSNGEIVDIHRVPRKQTTTKTAPEFENN